MQRDIALDTAFDITSRLRTWRANLILKLLMFSSNSMTTKKSYLTKTQPIQSN